jgi:mannose-1-phosphate guanylyltransferase
MSSGLIDTNNEFPPARGSSPALSPPDGTAGHRSAVVLAGGDGTRLQSLTLEIAGDPRPKQFCSFFGGKTLLAQTRSRLEALFHADRELFVVTRSHETYYREELRDVDESSRNR